MKEVSLLMSDHSEGDRGKESVMDFVLSYTLRKCVDKEETNEAIKEASKKVLCKLIKEENPDDVAFQDVKVWKQWSLSGSDVFDLIVEISLEKNCEAKNHVLVVENKVFTGLGVDQLKRYKEIIENFYVNYPNGSFKDKSFVLITCFDKENAKRSKKEKMLLCDYQNRCEENGWNLVYLDDLVKGIKPTGDTIFDEFWLKQWKRLED